MKYHKPALIIVASIGLFAMVSATIRPKIAFSAPSGSVGAGTVSGGGGAGVGAGVGGIGAAGVGSPGVGTSAIGAFTPTITIVPNSVTTGGVNIGTGGITTGGITTGGVTTGGVTTGGTTSSGPLFTLGGINTGPAGITGTSGPGISAGPGPSVGPGTSAGPGTSVGPGFSVGPGVSAGAGLSAGPGISAGAGPTAGAGPDTGPGSSAGAGVSVGAGPSTGTQPLPASATGNPNGLFFTGFPNYFFNDLFIPRGGETISGFGADTGETNRFGAATVPRSTDDGGAFDSTLCGYGAMFGGGFDAMTAYEAQPCGIDAAGYSRIAGTGLAAGTCPDDGLLNEGCGVARIYVGGKHASGAKAIGGNKLIRKSASGRKSGKHQP